MAESDDEPPALAYIEKTLADSYRKEIDQEENIWRSLPFFAATLALQMAALFQMIDKFPGLTSPVGWVAASFLFLALLLDLVSLGFLGGSIYPQKFNYVASEPDVLKYAENLILYEQKESSVSALVMLKRTLARQYAEGAHHNRQINKRRERRRSIAGLATLASVLVTVLLVVLIYSHYFYTQDNKESSHATGRTTASNASRPRADQDRRPIEKIDSAAPADARGHQGVVDHAGRDKIGG